MPSFPKAEHLVSLKEIELLFSKGSHSITCFPVKAVFRQVEEATPFPSRVLMSVSKKHLHDAVLRNKAKRQLREAYRLNKSSLWRILQENNKKLHIAWIWLSNEPKDSKQVTLAVQRLLKDIPHKLGL